LPGPAAGAGKMTDTGREKITNANAARRAGQIFVKR
jgi:hypothetical protein